MKTATILFAALVVAAPAACLGQESNEFWPEIDLSVRLSPAVRLIMVGSISRNRDSKYTEGTLGPALDFKANKFISFRTTYWHIASISHADEPYSENRFMLDAALRFPLLAKFRGSDRNRGDLREIGSEWSRRYRNRLRIERPIEARHDPLPYFSVEATYDSRYDRWNRKEYTLGCEVDLGHDSGLDFSVVRQIDPENPVKRVNAASLTWTLGL
jgi:uncharacterized protein DUF2490